MLGLCMTVRQRPSPQKNHSMTTKPQMKRTRISPEFHVGRAALLATAAAAGFHASLVSAAVIDKALVRNPKDRFPDARKLLASLPKLKP